MGYCSFQKTDGCWALIDDAGRTIAHVHGLRHLKLFQFAWDTQEALKAIEAICAADPDNPTARLIRHELKKLKAETEKRP